MGTGLGPLQTTLALFLVACLRLLIRPRAGRPGGMAVSSAPEFAFPLAHGMDDRLFLRPS